MKKIIVCLFIVTVLVLVNKEEIKVLIPEDAIRFRIIANSNSIEDQKEKIEIRNELEPIIGDILTNSTTKEETKTEINNNLYKINHVIDKFNTTYDVNYGLNFFPEKNYKGVTYKEGNYESLVITLGDGLGDNWWCVLFPPLCLLEANETNYDDITYTSYIQELINKY
ncbi:MAG: stage II sporulation protein R [Firmicutes bacterium]|jgi:putative stage II sporulation protein R|uniref:stage II sporulation protein R n=1 Tax=Candidatus Onthocola sp. TaxID=3085646 RepID=UPI0024244878|nr:stage II sporulation protein R [Bacillota bacterium]